MMSVFLFLLASGTAAPAAAAPPAPPLPKPERVCRATQAPLGSHMRVGKRCMTAEQWAEEDRRKALVPPSMQVNRAGDKVTDSPAK